MVGVDEKAQDLQILWWAGYRVVAHPSQKRGLIAPLIYPFQSRLFPASTAKPSHARIMRGYRTPSQAQNFHELMKEKVA